MTERKRYTTGMNTNFPTHRAAQLLTNFTSILTANAVGGGFCLALLFALAFICVHLIKCVKIGWKHRAETPQNLTRKKTEKEKTPPPPREPVYYVVDRNQIREKPPYPTHRENRFK